MRFRARKGMLVSSLPQKGAYRRAQYALSRCPPSHSLGHVSLGRTDCGDKSGRRSSSLHHVRIAS